MFRISFRALLSFALAMALSGLAWAHTELPLAKLTPPHGGLLAASGAYHVELVLKPDRVQVFVTDHLDKPINIQGVTGTANLRVKGKKAQRVPLRVVDDRLEGPAVIPADAPVTVMIRLNIGGAEQMVPYAWPAGGPRPKPAGR
ncbi:MAG: hypothetical protein Q8L71_07775 [Thiobacillus sp.]|nr:hypothetical protein [Thiobacillus sp.]